jgi:hypothetical protein
MNRTIYHILCRSKNLSSGFSASNSLGPVSASSSSSSSSSASAAPNGLSLVLLPKVLGAVGEAKLVRPPGLAAAPNPPPNPEKPDPKAAKPPEVLAPAANPVAAGFSVSDAAGDLKTDGVDAPSEPKGDCSDPANAARLDEAKAEVEVTAAGLVGSSSLDFDAPREPNGETADVFAKALVTGAC